MCSTRLPAEQLQQSAVVQHHASDADLRGLAAVREELAAASTPVDMPEAAAAALAEGAADGPAGPAAMEAATDILQALAGSVGLWGAVCWP